MSRIEYRPTVGESGVSNLLFMLTITTMLIQDKELWRALRNGLEIKTGSPAEITHEHIPRIKEMIERKLEFQTQAIQIGRVFYGSQELPTDKLKRLIKIIEQEGSCSVMD